jgi:hypothetical protein
MPPIQAIPTVEDAPQGTTRTLRSIDRMFDSPSSNPRFPTQPTFSGFSDSSLRFSTLNEPYTSYSNLTFETPITPDRVKLRVNFEPDRQGGNFGLGLPFE